MIEKHFLVPQYYILKIPKCDNCKINLEDTGRRLLTYPPSSIYKCPKCNKEYYFRENELEGEWKWRTI